MPAARGHKTAECSTPRAKKRSKKGREDDRMIEDLKAVEDEDEKERLRMEREMEKERQRMPAEPEKL